MASTFIAFTSSDVDQVVFSWRFTRMSTAARKDNADRSFYSTNFQLTSSIWKHYASSFFPTKLALRFGLVLSTLRSPSSDQSRMFIVCAKQTPISWQNSVGLWQRCFFMLTSEFGLSEWVKTSHYVWWYSRVPAYTEQVPLPNTLINIVWCDHNKHGGQFLLTDRCISTANDTRPLTAFDKQSSTSK